MSGGSSEERIYTIPLRGAWRAPWTDRAPTAVKIVKRFIERHLGVKAEEGSRVKISEELNRLIWSRGREKPPRRVKVRVVREEDVYTVYPAEEV
ncbi:MAG: 50S ribosomal protein L31e [Nitrososphaerota archaeon]|nr:60S ribosomal protein L31 [Candidatus Bathyarchaeota archaeon]MCX8162763.1 60S ribosomal protein L31 [Candidatus Bathyarchaeota archaeon]MDW8061358.1 50S ribosomal protein L31e [Nitrososphaerota archaeon]